MMALRAVALLMLVAGANCGKDVMGVTIPSTALDDVATSRTLGDAKVGSGTAEAAIKAWSKEDQDTFGIQQVLDKSHDATLVPGLLSLSQAFVMAVPNGGISVTVKAKVLGNGNITKVGMITTLAQLLHVPAATLSGFEARPTPYGTVGIQFFVGSTGTPAPAAVESKNNVTLALAFAVAVLALVLLLHAVAVTVSRCQVPKAPPVAARDAELEAGSPVALKKIGDQL